MTKTHLIKDESLGGVLREYVEVDRKAQIGDYVTRDGIIRKVEKRSDVCDGVEFEPYIDGDDGEDTIRWTDGYYKTLEPTDIIHIVGKRYRMVDRKANVGEKVIVISNDPLVESVGENHIGETHTVTDKGYNLIYTTGKWYDGSTLNLSESEYRVLEPIESPNSKTDDTSANIMYYRMVDRKANVGDEIIVTDSPIVKSGTIGTCIANSSGYDGLITIDVHSYEDMYALINADTDKYHVLELIDPLNDSVDVINIDGEYYRLVYRKANVGDKIFSDGIIREVEGRLDPINGIEFECYVDEDGNNVDGWLDGYYMVLEPVESQPTDQLDIIARLTRKVAQLERENTDIKRDLETWAQDVEQLKQKLNMIIDL